MHSSPVDELELTLVSQLLGLFEQLHQGRISCALFADARTLITSGFDCTIAVWWVHPSSESVVLHPKGNLFGHRQAVIALVTSRALSVIVSASQDGQVILWDLNRLEFVRELARNTAVDVRQPRLEEQRKSLTSQQYVRINNSNGHIMLCCRKKVLLYTLNGELLLEQCVCDGPNETVLCCAFYESEGNEWLDRELIFTGHSEGIVKVYTNLSMSFDSR